MNIDENGDSETNYTLLAFSEGSQNVEPDLVPVGHFTAMKNAMPVCDDFPQIKIITEWQIPLVAHAESHVACESDLA